MCVSAGMITPVQLLSVVSNRKNMNRKVRTTLLSVFTSVIVFTIFSLYISHDVFSVVKVRLFPLPNTNNLHHLNFATTEDQNYLLLHHHHLSNTRHVSSSISTPPPLPPDSILLPDWEILVVDSPDNSLSSESGVQYSCLFRNNVTSPAKFTGTLPFSHRATFKCEFPESVRHLRPFRRPILTKSVDVLPESVSDSPEMFRWGFLAYESLSTETDVILFVKGVNNRQGVNRSPDEFTCVFTNGVNNSVKTTVTSSSQEVFRCHHPNDTAVQLFNEDEKIKISLEIKGRKRGIVPSVAYYTPRRSVVGQGKKSLLCACTMVHNVGKFLKEWVMFNSKLGVDKFILYDNDSEDDLEKVVEGLEEEDYNVERLLWPWPKTQEGGFSHCAIHAKESCTWMMYMDVDEFVFSPSWRSSSHPSHNILTSFLPNVTSSTLFSPSSSHSNMSLQTRPIGQVSIRCLEFGPSNQSTHPISGVTQGYTCRRRMEQRHKSIVLLDAIDVSLHNAIHHFKLKQGYRSRTLRLNEGVVNHYKYQAWSEFKEKFRRRVSAYVVDWKQEVNPMSNDRTPGLGFEPIEPEGWANKFCEVQDTRLKMATRRWFGYYESNGYKMAWQDQ